MRPLSTQNIFRVHYCTVARQMFRVQERRNELFLVGSLSKSMKRVGFDTLAKQVIDCTLRYMLQCGIHISFQLDGHEGLELGLCLAIAQFLSQ